MMLWNPNLETGIPQIDQQHKEWFRRVNGLLTAGKEGRGQDEVAHTLDFLEHYVVQHFQEEEALMTQCTYPKGLVHKRQHQKYIAELRTIQETYVRDGATLTMIIAINRNMVDWMTQHINTFDKELASYYRTWTEQRS